MAKVTIRTIGHRIGWANVHHQKVFDEYRNILDKFPDYVVIPMSTDFRSFPQSHGCDKLIVYAWYWHGEWSAPGKGVFAILYKPKK